VTLEEVVVTDFKQNRRNLTPTASTRADARLLQDQQVVSIKELSAVMPNFFMPDYGSRANTPIYIRGIGAKSKGAAVGFYVDGVPHYESSAFDIDLSDIAAIDVLRGPQGTLYGRNAIAGIINVYTHNRSTTRTHASDWDMATITMSPPSSPTIRCSASTSVSARRLIPS
jgi:outer membrane receptor protein involved in Fe transport